MRVYAEPPLDHWHVNTSNRIDRSDLIERIAANAHRFGTGQPTHNQSLIATGHQAWLWHPGILAKDLAMLAAAKRLNTGMYHLVVDQDAHEALRLELPVIHDDHLSIETVQLAATDPAVPTGWQPPADPGEIQQNLINTQRRLGDNLAIDLQPIIEAFNNPPPCQTLAQQITVALAHLREPYTKNPIPILFVSDLLGMTSYQRLLEEILADATQCVTHYNNATDHYPQARIAKLRVEPDRVELPLWALQWGQPRQRVFADLAGTPPIFVLDNGQPIAPVSPLTPALRTTKSTPTETHQQSFTLVPRALLLTAVLRQHCCDFFIHGRGGGEYDRVMEDWWQNWCGDPNAPNTLLAPTATVSVDVQLDLPVPAADTDDLRHAVWQAHHTPHNIDRSIPVDKTKTPIIAEKHRLIEHMNDDRNRQRRAAAFDRIHQINKQLANNHPEIITNSTDQLVQTQIGIANHRIATKRDWCLSFYEPSQLRAINNELVSQINPH